MSPIAVAPTVAELRRTVGGWRAGSERVALVPTMGALHEGHLSLVRIARRRAGGGGLDLRQPDPVRAERGPRQVPAHFEEDCARLAGLADLVFAPAADEMYAPDAATAVVPAGPASVGLEDRFRPTHFQGVATVVAKLLIQAAPDLAVFGEKDYQQLKVIARAWPRTCSCRSRSCPRRSCASRTGSRCPRATASCRRTSAAGAGAVPRPDAGGGAHPPGQRPRRGAGRRAGGAERRGVRDRLRRSAGYADARSGRGAAGRGGAPSPAAARLGATRLHRQRRGSACQPLAHSGGTKPNCAVPRAIRRTARLLSRPSREPARRQPDARGEETAFRRGAGRRGGLSVRHRDRHDRARIRSWPCPHPRPPTRS